MFLPQATVTIIIIFTLGLLFNLRDIVAIVALQERMVSGTKGHNIYKEIQHLGNITPRGTGGRTVAAVHGQF